MIIYLLLGCFAIVTLVILYKDRKQNPNNLYSISPSCVRPGMKELIDSCKVLKAKNTSRQPIGR